MRGAPDEDPVADDAVLEVAEHLLDGVGGVGRRLAAGELGDDLLLDRGDAVAALLLDDEAVGLVEAGAGQGLDGILELGVRLGRRPVPLRLARGGDERVDRVERGLHGLVTEGDGAQHHVLGEP